MNDSTNLVDHFKDQLANDVPLPRAIQLTPNHLIPPWLTVGDCFDAARYAGYQGILPPRSPKPGDGQLCPECETTNTWESHCGSSYLYCRNCLEVYDMTTLTLIKNV